MSNGNGEDKDLPNLDILIKCMKMTTSDNDNQALVALRAANRQVAKFGGDWETILRGKIKIIGDPFGSSPAFETRRTTAPAAPPRPPQRPTPPPPPQPQPRYTPPPPPPPRQPSNGDIRVNLHRGTCNKCSKPVASNSGREVYHSLLGSWITEHVTCPQPPRRDNERSNKYAGTCVKCNKRVEAFTGTTYHDGSRWRTEHHDGKCPKPGTTRRKQPLTSDDLLS